MIILISVCAIIIGVFVGLMIGEALDIRPFAPIISGMITFSIMVLTHALGAW